MLTFSEGKKLNLSSVGVGLVGVGHFGESVSFGLLLGVALLALEVSSSSSITVLEYCC